MTSYVLLLRDRGGRLVTSYEFTCADDSEAQFVAQRDGSGEAGELWRGGQLIASWAAGENRAGSAIGRAFEAPLSVPDGAAIIATSPAGTVAYWDRNAAQLYGWSTREAVGRNIIDLTPAAQSREEAMEIMRALQAGHSWAGEIVLRRKDGTPFRAFVLDVPLGRVAEGRGMIVGVSLPIERGADIEAMRGDIAAELHARLDGEVV